MQARSRRFEIILLALGLAGWSVSLVSLLGGRSLAGLTPVGLYALYGTASVLGWGLGNLYVARARGEARVIRRVLLSLYLLAPPGVLFALWATARTQLQIGAPLAPVYASGIFGVLFLVPLTFARGGSANRR
jgi:hypothetical protein